MERKEAWVKIQLHHPPAMWPWKSHFASLSLCPLLYLVRIDLPTGLLKDLMTELTVHFTRSLTQEKLCDTFTVVISGRLILTR